VWGLLDKPYLGVRPVNLSHEKPFKSAWRFTDAVESWNWQGYEGKKAVAEVYGDGHSARLWLNGKQLGKKRLKKYRAVFKTVYQPGILTAELLDKDGNKLSETSLKTGDEVTVLRAVPENATLRANGQDLCFLPIEIVDTRGGIKPARDINVKLRCEGPVTLQGFGSALHSTDETYHAAAHTTWQGRALAVLRAGKTPGKATVMVTAENLPPVMVELDVAEAGNTKRYRTGKTRE
jgi:hypothetical protein